MTIRQINVITGKETTRDFTDAENKHIAARKKDLEDTAVERAWASLREERDAKLTKSDWMTLPDSPDISDEWKAYRKKLRDLPGTLNDTTVLKTITWPDEPE
jgi:hypothetical protein